MASNGFQALTEVEVREQLRALGYHSFSPEKVRQITKDLATYLAEEGVFSDTTDQSFVSDTGTAYNTSTTYSPRQPLQEVTVPTRPVVRFEQPERPGKENHRSLSNRGVELPKYDDEPLFDASSCDQSYTSDTSQMNRPGSSSKPFIKRKVVRKRNGRAQVFDESITESESDVSYLNDRLAELRLPLREEEPLDEEETDSEASTVIHRTNPNTRPRSSSSRISESGSSRCSERYSNQPLKSFIRPMSAPVKWKHNKKTDPVTRHQMYATQWKSIKAPGERSHKGLRWQIREQMLYKDEVTPPRNQPRVYVPNTYQVPTEKKRQALRWAVRNSLANREMPYSTFNFPQ